MRPFTPFKKILKGDAEPETKYPTAWSWLILLYLYESFARDHAREHEDEEQFQKYYDLLRGTGLVPNPDLRKAVLTSLKATFSLELPGIKAGIERGGQRQGTTDFPFFIEALKVIALRVRTPNRHLLIIDGVDDVLTKREVQFEALSALIYEANRLNQTFAAKGVFAKVLVLCRTDLFERLPGANSNKIRQDGAVHLDWYRDVRHPQDSDLIKLINRRASVLTRTTLTFSIDTFRTAFRDCIVRGERYSIVSPGPNSAYSSRHDYVDEPSPREREVASAVKRRPTQGATAYSKEYFLPEIQNELRPCGLVGRIKERGTYCYSHQRISLKLKASVSSAKSGLAAC